ncbi:MAG TPA: HAD family hydrolase [Fervidobacterium sp.]|nr:HAD family hydrolase [Fervidobacterium sp.]HOM74308.1 HAD family hydrolase [Fervidobacterium sp.]HOQ39895.1 HAD family hydrolase [Fervidobacterium sp.]HPP17995.1 HAD family hydrolase [Fervidobacterium sp.]HPT55001.1 HAD family hydrolase [Fervidobacterium sp.]
MYVFVDYDGTIVKSSEEEFMKAYFKNLSNYFGMPFEEALSLVMQSVDEAMNNPNENISLYLKFAEAFSRRTNRPFDYWVEKFTYFYENMFDQVKSVIQPNLKLTGLMKSTVQKLVFASNPLFPEIATIKRIQFAGLSPDDFVYIAHMENCRFAKPNPMFFKDIMDKLNIVPQECVMIGDSEFDKVSEKVGIRFVHIADEDEWEKLF